MRVMTVGTLTVLVTRNTNGRFRTPGRVGRRGVGRFGTVTEVFMNVGFGDSVSLSDDYD